MRGTGSSNNVIRAERVTLLGRRVAAPQTGVGQTRTPTSVSTPTAGGTTPSTAPDRIGRVDGIVRQVNATEGRIVVETDRREILTVRTVASTPVIYQGNTYRLNIKQPYADPSLWGGSNLYPNMPLNVHFQHAVMLDESETASTSRKH